MNIEKLMNGGDDQQSGPANQQSNYDYEHPEQSGDPYKFGETITRSINPDKK